MTRPSPAPSTPGPSAPPRDPLADLDPALWSVHDARSLLAAPVDSRGVDTAAWTSAGITAEVITEVRRALAAYVQAAYLQPETVRGLDETALRERLISAAPEAWHEPIGTAFASHKRLFYVLQLDTPFRVVGAVRGVADWHLAQSGTARVLRGGGTLACTAIDTRSARTGVVAIRWAVTAQLSATAPHLSEGSFSTSVHGLDLCASSRAQGRQVPAIDGSAAAEAAQKGTMTQVIGDPRIGRLRFTAKNPAALADAAVTVMPVCSG